MIVKILKSSGSFPAVEYNERKVSQGVAERVELRNFGFLQNNSGLAGADSIIRYLVDYSNSKNTSRVKFPQFHVTFSSKGKSMSKQQLVDYANQWLERMGYSQNPMAIYFHQDTDNNHLHVITTRVGPDGKKVDHNHERRRSQQIIGELEKINPKEQSEQFVKDALSYSFQSLGQFRSILESAHYETYEESENLNVKKGGVVQTQIPIQLIKDHYNFDDVEERKKKASQLRAWLLRYKTMCYNKEELTKLMHTKFGVDLIFHGKGVGSKEFKPYGYTIVDHHSKIVFKGSEVLVLKQLLDFIQFSREEKENEINMFIDDAIQRNRLVTTFELNRLLKKQTNAYISKGQLVLNGKKVPLKDNVVNILKLNDRLAWVQSFSPNSAKEKSALCSLFKVLPDELRVVSEQSSNKRNVIDSVRILASQSDAHSFRDSLAKNGFKLFRFNNDSFILSFSQPAIVNVSDIGIDMNLIENNVSHSNDNTTLNITDGLNIHLPEIPVSGILESSLQVAADILNVGDEGFGGVGGGGNGTARRKKKKKDERDKNGLSY